MSPMYTLLLLCALSALCTSLPYRFSRRLPSSLITRIANPFEDEDDVIAMVPLARARRSQPIVDYTDEFSADPFEFEKRCGSEGYCNLCRKEVKKTAALARSCSCSNAIEHKSAGSGTMQLGRGRKPL